MKAGSGEHFEQSYNAQATVEVEDRLIVGQRVSQAPNDKQELVATFSAIVPEAGAVGQALVDSGFVSEEAVGQIETGPHGEPSGVKVLAAMKRAKHGRTVSDLEKKEDPAPPAADAPFVERMIYRVATKAGRQRYKLRQQTVEPVFGIIKEALGFRRFSLRGLSEVSLEWTLVSLSYNLKRLFTLGAQLKAA
ncbi:MAG: transposase [Chthoniobacteraceae bacterium]|nr:transposase [Chthoniobacteraceae bacterium]